MWLGCFNRAGQYIHLIFALYNLISQSNTYLFKGVLERNHLRSLDLTMVNWRDYGLGLVLLSIALLIS